MNLQEAIEQKSKHEHLLGVCHNDGTTYIDVIIAPIDNICRYIQDYVTDFDEARCIALYPSNDYGVIAIDRNQIKEGLLAYRILNDNLE